VSTYIRIGRIDKNKWETDDKTISAGQSLREKTDCRKPLTTRPRGPRNNDIRRLQDFGFYATVTIVRDKYEPHDGDPEVRNERIVFRRLPATIESAATAFGCFVVVFVFGRVATRQFPRRPTGVR